MRCKLKYKVRVVCESHLVQNTKYSTLNILVITSTVHYYRSHILRNQSYNLKKSATPLLRYIREV